jgi:predicted GNAT superfamily acetyltransferase
MRVQIASEWSLYPLKVRPLTQLNEFAEVVLLQQEIWGFEDVELLPRRLFVVASKIGGQVLGAYDGEKLVAFCLCIPGIKPDGKPYLYSHMLGVHTDYRNNGLGRELKWTQRQYALATRVDLIEWTFDPLEIKNAFFNIQKLGAIVRRFVHNQYGTTTSHLHAGLPTDRLIAEWWIRTPRVLAREGSVAPIPVEVEELLRIEVPADIAAVRRADPERARQVQTSIGSQFDEYFRRGLAVVGFERNEEFGVYLLGKWESN